MSGPIVRKYGFPNFESIFGKRELQHGVEETESSSEEKAKEAGEGTSAKTAKPEGKKKTGGK